MNGAGARIDGRSHGCAFLEKQQRNSFMSGSDSSSQCCVGMSICIVWHTWQAKQKLCALCITLLCTLRQMASNHVIFASASRYRCNETPQHSCCAYVRFVNRINHAAVLSSW